MLGRNLGSLLYGDVSVMVSIAEQAGLCDTWSELPGSQLISLGVAT